MKAVVASITTLCGTVLLVTNELYVPAFNSNVCGIMGFILCASGLAMSVAIVWPAKQASAA